MSLNVTIGNMDKVLSDLKTYPGEITKVINNEFKVFGIQTAGEAKRLAPVNEGRLRQSINDVLTDLRISVAANVNYAPYLEFGTKGFAAAYIGSLPADWQEFASQYKGAGGGTFAEMLRAIKDWVRLKGIASGKDVDQAAYRIAKSILIKGIRPHPFLYPAYAHQKINLIKNLKSRLNAK